MNRKIGKDQRVGRLGLSGRTFWWPPLLCIVSIALAGDPNIDRISLPSTTPTSQRFKDVVAIMEKADATKDEFEVERIAAVVEGRLRYIAGRMRGCEIAYGQDMFRQLGDCLQEISLVVVEPAPEDEVRPPIPDLGIPRELAGGWKITQEKYSDGISPLNLLAGLCFMKGEIKDFQVIGILKTGDKTFQSKVLATLVRDIDLHSIVQWNAELMLDWGPLPCEPDAATIEANPDLRQWDMPVFIHRIELLNLEAITRPSTVFEDASTQVLSTSLLDDVMQGADYFSRRTDRLLGNDTLGHAGLCVGDVNDDGRDDLYVAMGGGQANMLLVQQEDGTVVDTAREAHVDFLDMTRACLFADMDNDRDQDLVLSIRNATVIMENEGGVFKETPALNARTGTPSEFYSIAAADYDKNGFLDLYSTRYVRASYGISVPLPYFDANNGPPNHLLANLGHWKFEDVTEKVGLEVNNRRFSLAASWEDFDDDGDPDLYVANDFGRANFYINDNGQFTDRAEELGASNQAAGMGVSWADYDRDGRMDLYVSNMFSPAGARIMSSPEFRPQDTPEQRRTFLGHVMGNALFHQLPGGKFEKATTALRQGIEGWSWGSMFVDINNDGYEDLLVPNGNMTGSQSPDIDSLFWRQVAPHTPLTESAAPKYADGWAAMSLLMTKDYSWAGHQRNVTYLNLGDGRFADISAISGFGFEDDGRALAVTDWDRDGDLDLWIKNRTGPQLRYLRNDTLPPQPSSSSRDPLGDANWVELLVRPSSPPFDGVGAKVRVIAGGKTLVDSVRAGEGYLAQSSRWIHFGLADRMDIERVEVSWPDGTKESFAGVHADGRFVLEQGTGTAQAHSLSLTSGPKRDSDQNRDRKFEDAEKDETLVLLDKAALPDLVLTTADGRKISTESLLGQPIALLFWSSRSQGSLDVLRGVAQSMPQLREKKWQIIPVCVDGSDQIESARAAATAISSSLPVIMATPELLDLVDVMQQEVLGRPDDLLLPTVWALDDLGLLAWWGRGPLSGSEVVHRLLDPSPFGGPPSGRILFRESRNYGFLAEELRKRNRPEFFEYYRLLSSRQRNP